MAEKQEKLQVFVTRTKTHQINVNPSTEKTYINFEARKKLTKINKSVQVFDKSQQKCAGFEHFLTLFEGVNFVKLSGFTYSTRHIIKEEIAAGLVGKILLKNLLA